VKLHPVTEMLVPGSRCPAVSCLMQGMITADSLSPANGRCARCAGDTDSLEGSKMLGMASPLCRPQEATEVEFEL